MSRDRKPQRRSGHRHKEDLMRPQSNDFEYVDDSLPIANWKLAFQSKSKTSPVAIKDWSSDERKLFLSRLVSSRSKTSLAIWSKTDLVKSENRSSMIDWRQCMVLSRVFRRTIEWHSSDDDMSGRWLLHSRSWGPSCRWDASSSLPFLTMEQQVALALSLATASSETYDARPYLPGHCLVSYNSIKPLIKPSLNSSVPLSLPKYSNIVAFKTPL